MSRNRKDYQVMMWFPVCDIVKLSSEEIKDYQNTNDEISSYIADMAEINQLKLEILGKIHELKYGLHKDEDDLVIVINSKHYSLLFRYYEENNKWLSLDEERTKTTMFGVLLKQGFVENPVVGLR